MLRWPTPYLHLPHQWIWGHWPWHKRVGPNTCNHGWEESHDITLWYSTWIHWHHCVIPRPAIPGSVLLLCHWYPPQRSSPQSHCQGEESKSYSANRTYLPPLKLNSQILNNHLHHQEKQQKYVRRQYWRSWLECCHPLCNQWERTWYIILHLLWLQVIKILL